MVNMSDSSCTIKLTDPVNGIIYVSISSFYPLGKADLAKKDQQTLVLIYYLFINISCLYESPRSDFKFARKIIDKVLYCVGWRFAYSTYTCTKQPSK